MNNISLLSHRKEEPENGILYIVGTPIGNLNDISQRALHILQNVSLVACEDTRQTKKIMNKFNISNKLISFNKHNSSIKIPKLVKDLNDLINAGLSLSAASKYLSKRNGLKKSEIYNMI